MPNFEIHRVEMGDNMAAATKRAHTLIAARQITLDKFSHYDPDIIAQDLAYVQNKKAEIARANTPEENRKAEMAKVFEAMMLDCGGRYHWFGNDVTMVKPSEFDDLKGGVDLVAESKPERQHLALAIDATYSTQERFLRKKFDFIRHEIEQGKLAFVRYFISPNFNTKGILEKVPRVVVGADARTVSQMAEFWLEERSDLLERHPIQFQILDEIRRQCEAFVQFARRINQKEVADQYAQAQQVVTQILETRKQTLKDVGWRDDGFKAISEELELFRN